MTGVRPPAAVTSVRADAHAIALATTYQSPQIQDQGWKTHTCTLENGSFRAINSFEYGDELLCI